MYVICDLRNFGFFGSILDFVFMNNDFLVENVVVRFSVFDLDYYLFIFKLYVKMRRLDIVWWKVYCYKRVDF